MTLSDCCNAIVKYIHEAPICTRCYVLCYTYDQDQKDEQKGLLKDAIRDDGETSKVVDQT
jgi:hypothetical protein